MHRYNYVRMPIFSVLRVNEFHGGCFVVACPNLVAPPSHPSRHEMAWKIDIVIGTLYDAESVCANRKGSGPPWRLPNNVGPDFTVPTNHIGPDDRLLCPKGT